MKGFKIYLLMIMLQVVTECEPAARGTLKVFNETEQMLTAKYALRTNKWDTVFTEIEPHSNKTIQVVQGRGSNSSYANCCPCHTDTIIIISSQGRIKKDPNDYGNWNTPNKKKMKKFFGPDFKCEFHVLPTDL